jgi:hypothetical protein
MQRIETRLATPDEVIKLKHRHFDFTKLSAIATCPVWGMVRYAHHKTTSGHARAMALEAGEAMHQVFAAVRIMDALDNISMYPSPRARDLVLTRLRQMYDETRSEEFLSILFNYAEDDRVRRLKAGLYILESSGFYDDPGDNRRTMNKLSEAAMVYIDRYDFGKYIPFVDMQTEFVGVEQPFAIHVSGPFEPLIFTGKIDGVHNFKETLRIEENKTSSRLNDAWQMSFDTSHQVTGYLIAASTIVKKYIDTALVRGLAIPQPIRGDNGILDTFIRRERHSIVSWAEWLAFIVDIHDKYYLNPTDAPMFTHSCNRYFRPCNFIPLCAADKEERRDMFAQLVNDEWSPLDEKASD